VNSVIRTTAIGRDAIAARAGGARMRYECVRVPESVPPAVAQRDAKPVMISVDDDPGVSRAVQRDLRRQYGEHYRVLRAESGAEGLEMLGQARLREEPVALMVADQRMPQMTGVEFLERALEVAPDAKRVLLTAYADTQAAIDAINKVALDHYLLKPWDPPEEQLYPVLDDLLADWQAGAPPELAVRVIGHRFSRESHELKDFLARNNVPYRWLYVELDPEAQVLLGAGGGDRATLPLLVFPDGEVMTAPSNRAVADRLGMRTRAEGRFYDLVVVGAGPAGLAAAVYGASEGLRTVLVERDAPGGQAGQSSRIENYLGFPVGLSGGDLTRRATAQARRFGAELLSVTDAMRLEARGPARTIVLDGSDEISAHAVVVATGVQYRRLDIPGGDALTGRGLYYGGSRTEALACEGEQVVVVGGANSAGQAALSFARHAAAVTIVHRGADLRDSMSQYLVDRIEAASNIRVELRTEVVAAHGEESLDAVTLRDRDSGEEHRAAGRSVFIFIGASPNTDWLDGQVARDPHGFILAGPELRAPGVRPPWPLERPPLTLETSLPGVFVAGDVRQGSIKRVAGAVGDGSMSVQLVHQYLGTLG
jgi:thioredoxin reductase (NADPH)